MTGLDTSAVPKHRDKALPSRPPKRSTMLALIVLALVTAVAIHGIDKGEFNLNTDETVHAVTGLYVADFLRDLPLAHPVQYTFRYYAQYPEFGLLHWPPFFYFAEAIAFLFLHPSVVVARLTILAFSTLGFYFWFKLVNEMQNEWAAALSTGILAFLPFVLLYEKAVMLEMPSLALCIAATYFWLAYLRSGASRLVYSFALFTALALLTKYQAVYLPIFCLLTVVAGRKWALVLSRPALRAFGIILLLTTPYYLLALVIHGRVLLTLAQVSLAGRVPAPGGHYFNPYTYYWATLPDQLGWPLLLLSIAGVATCRWWDRKENSVAMVMWVASCYLALSFLGAKDPRYTIYWLPPFIYFATGPLAAMLSRSVEPASQAAVSTNLGIARWLRILGAAAALALFGTYLCRAWTYQRPYVSGYAAVAARLTQSDDSGFVLFDGELPGNLIFFMRSFDAERRFFILRKSMYLPKETQSAGEPVQSVAQLKKFIDTYGIKHIIVSKRSPAFAEEGPAQEQQKIQAVQDVLLRKLLKTPQFRLAGEFPVETNMADLKGDNLLLYESASQMSRSARTLTIQTSGMSQAFDISLDNSQHR